MNVTELIHFLNRVGVRPKKSLSQNFLIDAHIVRKAADLAEVSGEDIVLEIGPGPGALTQELLKRGARVYAVEIDRVFARELNRFQTGKLTVIETDFLQFPLSSLPAGFKVVANLPYHITTPILEKLFSYPFASLTLMVQKELADRIGAQAGTKTFGSLSLFTQFYTKFYGSFPVGASCFFPQPKVDSTVIRLDRQTPPAIDPVPFFSLVHKAFQQRRKMLSSTLPFPKEEIRQALREIGMREDARPEMLSLDHWVQFAQILTKH